jgi:hypothetical protein
MMDSDPSLEDVTQEETGVRLRVYPTRIQQQVLKRWIGTQRCPRQRVGSHSAGSTDLKWSLGADRGVVNSMTDDTGRFYDFTPAEKTKLLRREKKRTDFQIKLARQKKGSRRRWKTKKQIGTAYARDRHLRTAVAHRISNHLVVQAVERGCVAIGFEDLCLGNMTQRHRCQQAWCWKDKTVTSQTNSLIGSRVDAAMVDRFSFEGLEVADSRRQRSERPQWVTEDHWGSYSQNAKVIDDVMRF